MQLLLEGGGCEEGDGLGVYLESSCAIAVCDGDFCSCWLGDDVFEEVFCRENAVVRPRNRVKRGRCMVGLYLLK